MQNKYQLVHNFVQNSKHLDFCSLSDSVLSSDDAIMALDHAKDMLRDRRRVWCDFKMLDTFKKYVLELIKILFIKFIKLSTCILLLNSF